MDQISREAMDEMMLYEWPGNVRELENAIERAVVVGKGRSILPEDLPILCSPDARGSPGPVAQGDRKNPHRPDTGGKSDGNIAQERQNPGYRPIHPLQQDQALPDCITDVIASTGHTIVSSRPSACSEARAAGAGHEARRQRLPVSRSRSFRC